MKTRNKAWISRRTVLGAIAASLGPPGVATAQAYPTQTVRIIFPFAAGGGGDTLARVLAPKLSEALRQPVIVDNRVGASGIIGTDAVIKAAPDGHTLLLHAMPMVITPATFSSPPYDPVRDLTPIAELISSPLWLAVSASRSSAKSLREFVDQLRSEPARHQYASASPGSTGHLYGFQLAESNHLDMNHIGYKGAAPAVLALLNGEITAAILDMVVLKPHLASGKIRLIAVTGTARSDHAPEVPTFIEQGFPGFESNSWAGLSGPKGLPPAIVQQLAGLVAQALKDPAVGGRYRSLGYDLGTLSQPQFAALVASDRDKWAVLVKRAGVKAN
jgi:tripartite-type tricarboxylate transporter receptor subunit TctC